MNSRFKILSCCLVLAAGGATTLASDIHPDAKFSWSENAGWMNWADAGEPAGTNGITFHETHLAGRIWSENVGWINLGNGLSDGAEWYANIDETDFGVNVDLAGHLHGYAWSENAGWLNFDGGAAADANHAARIECDGRFNGYVWSENLGWINLSSAEPSKHVELSADARPYACDLNHDGFADGGDVQFFTDFLLHGGAAWRDICSGDIESTLDDAIDLDDVAPFVDCLLGQ